MYSTENEMLPSTGRIGNNYIDSIPVHPLYVSFLSGSFGSLKKIVVFCTNKWSAFHRRKLRNHRIEAHGPPIHLPKIRR